MSKSVATIVLILVVVGGGFYAYTNLFDGGTAATNESMESSADAGAELLALLDRLQRLKLSTAIFSSPQFQSLQDETTPIDPEPVGRNNPFAPIGRDTFFVSTRDITAGAGSSSATTSASGGSKPIQAGTTTKPSSQ